MSGENREIIRDNFDVEEIDDLSETMVTIKDEINIDARRRLEDYLDQLELKRLINDDLDYLDDIA